LFSMLSNIGGFYQIAQVAGFCIFTLFA